MKFEKAWLDALEYIFELGAGVTRLTEPVLDQTESIYRAIFIPPFDSSYLLNVYVVGDIAEVQCYLLPRSFDYKVLKAIKKAFENNEPPPLFQPEVFLITSARKALTLSQLIWFLAEMKALDPATIQSSLFTDVQVRDGELCRGIIRQEGGAPHSFDFGLADSYDDYLGQYNYYKTLFKLAASTLVSPPISDFLLKIQRYWFGARYIGTHEFAFLSIE
ncbi:MAG: hypothetical protein ABI947_04745 [Chloroflexota bacterium]